MSKNIKSIVSRGLILVSLLAMGCGGAKGAGGAKSGDQAGVAVGPDGQRVISKKAREDFQDAVEKWKAAEKAGWTEASCKSMADDFKNLAKRYNNMQEALYNVGVVYRKCNMEKEAREAFNETLSKHPNHQLAMTQLAVMHLEKGEMQAGEDMLRKAVGAGMATLEAVPAYVNAATILRMKASQKSGGDDESFQKAQMNLRRALAIDSKYMPALYQLAMLYLDMAITKKKKSYLTLASLVCTQGIGLDPEYGPIYHALGQVFLHKNQLVKALQSFETAFKKDPNLFASYMNFGAINLNFRGYQEAKMAFEKAIALDPKSYDAHIGLGVALRGLEDYEGAKAEYKKASEIDPKRTDFIFNMGVLEMDYLNNGTPEGYEKAKAVFKKFLNKANDNHRVDPDGKGGQISWVDKAQKRVEQCDKNIEMIKQAEQEMREMEKLAAEQAKREAEAKAAMERAKELEKKEAAGEQAPEGAEGAEGTAEGTADAQAGAESK